MVIYFTGLILLKSAAYLFFYSLYILSCRIHLVHLTPGSPVLILIPQRRVLFIDHHAAFPFRCPIKPDTFGGISGSICTWSDHAPASMVPILFHSHNCPGIFTAFSLFSPHNTFLRYSVTITIWYLQFHFVCTELLCRSLG